MGSKGTSTQQATSTYTPSPAIQAAGNQALGMAQSAASQPFNLPVAPVAGFTPQQQQAFQQYGSLQGMAQPYYNQAQGLFNQSASPISGSQVNNYLNPYAGYVLGNLQEQQGQQMNDLTGRATQTAGGVGADRIGVAQGELARQQSLATGQTLSGIYGSALSAAQQDAQRQQAAAYGIGNLGGAAQNAALQGTQALYGSGALQQQQNQAQLNAPYQNQLAKLAFPYQNAQYLAGITGNLAGALGGTTNSNQQSTPAQPSIWSQLLGAGTAGVGLAGNLGAFNGSASYGGGSPFTGDAYGGSAASPLTGLSPSDYGVGYADGGEVPNVTGDAGWMGADPAIPNIQMRPSQVHQPQVQPMKSDQGSGGGFDLGKAIGTAATFLPFLARGGAAYPKYADGGDVSDDTRAQGLDILRNAMTQKYGVNSNDPIREPDQAAVQAWRDNTPTNNIGTQVDGAELPQTASATSGNTNPYAGLSPAAADTSAANLKAMGDQTYPVPYDVDHQGDQSREWARSPWMALMNAGFGMMAGTSPFAGVNIGKGLQEGVKTLEGQRKESREEEGVNQRAKQLAMEAQKHLDQYTKLTPIEAANVENQKAQLKLHQDQLEQQGWQKGAENILTGDVTYFNPRTEESGILKADGTWTPKGAATAPPAGTTPNPAITTPAPAPPPGNTPTETPAPFGVKDLSSNLEPTKSDIGFIGKGSPLAQASQKDVQVEIARQSKAAAMLPALKQDLGAMKLSFQTLTKDADKDGFLSQLALQPGATFGDRLEMARKANALKIAAGEPPPFNPEKVAAAENINKIQNRMGLTFSSQISPREAFAGQKIGIESSPGLTNTPGGFRRLIAGFEAAAENATDEQKFFQQYLKKNGTSLGWRQDFEAKNPAERYIVKHIIGTLPELNQKHISEDVEALRKDPSPKNVALFNKHYADTAGYFLNGKI